MADGDVQTQSAPPPGVFTYSATGGSLGDSTISGTTGAATDMSEAGKIAAGEVTASDVAGTIDTTGGSDSDGGGLAPPAAASALSKAIGAVDGFLQGLGHAAVVAGTVALVAAVGLGALWIYVNRRPA